MYLAVDIGASSGRHILGWLEDGRLQLKEIYRFENGMTEQEGSFVWDVEHLVAEIVNGLKACKAEGVSPQSVAIDTWGVDYALLDAEGNLLSPVYAYRDSRTEGAAEEIDALIPREELYRRTGIQKQNYNTIYQLWCDKKSGKLQKAAHFLMMPEYLAYRLTGRMANEYTIASTSGLLNAESRQWDGELLRLLGLPEGLFLPLSQPGTALGALSE
ncbi:MAG: rhamnulokinase, partial [Clostridia bacterium]|nr:rhamnulokinase [Clostridia bacterium]